MTLRLPGTRSFRDKVTWVVAVTSAVAIALVAVALAAVNHFALRNAAFDALHAQAQVAAMNSGAPLVFGDRDTAAEVLGAFQAMPGIDRATLYTLDGTVFARYRRAPRERDAGRNGLLEALPVSERRFLTTLPVEEKGSGSAASRSPSIRPRSNASCGRARSSRWRLPSWRSCWPSSHRVTSPRW